MPNASGDVQQSGSWRIIVPLRLRLLRQPSCHLGSADWHCRKNGRNYRLTPAKDETWILDRVDKVGGREGAQLGRYQRRGDATKVVLALAYQPEARWWPFKVLQGYVLVVEH